MTVSKTGSRSVRQSTSSRQSSPSSKFQMLPITRLLPTPDNRRRPITQASVESLARSMARDGVLQPVVVRPHPTRAGFWEIRAGERRWRAAKLAKITHLPAIVRQLDDQAALSVTLAENLQRQNLHPLEEAATIQQAFARQYDPAAIASNLGKSVHYVARRASLTQLTKRWQTAVLTPDSEASRFSPAHLELIARLPATTQDLLSDRDFQIVFGRGFPSVDDLRRIIDAGMHSLKAMPWRTDDETLDPKAGACTSCPKRSGRQPLLFEADEGGGTSESESGGGVSKSDRCLDPSCYDTKLGAHLARCEAALRRSHPQLHLVQVTYERLSPATAKAFGDRIERTSQPVSVKAKGRRSIPAMAVDGPKAGRLVFLPVPPAPTKANGSSKARGKSKSAKDSTAERTARLHHRRQSFVVKQVESALKSMSDDDLNAIAARWDGAKPAKNSTSNAQRADVLALLLSFGTTVRADRHTDSEAWPSYERWTSQSGTSRTVKALREMLPIWSRRLSGVDGSTAEAQSADAQRMCALLGIDYAALERQAATAIPTPKSWSSAR